MKFLSSRKNDGDEKLSEARKNVVTSLKQYYIVFFKFKFLFSHNPSVQNDSACLKKEHNLHLCYFKDVLSFAFLPISLSAASGFIKPNQLQHKRSINPNIYTKSLTCCWMRKYKRKIVDTFYIRSFFATFLSVIPVFKLPQHHKMALNECLKKVFKFRLLKAIIILVIIILMLNSSYNLSFK